MTSLFRKAARMNLMAMDFVMQVTVVELVLGTLAASRTLSFELSRGTKVSLREVEMHVHSYTTSSRVTPK